MLHMERIPATVLIGGLSVIGFVSLYAWRIKKKKFDQSRFHRVEVKIHNAEVGLLIGKRGEQLKNIIQKSGAKVKFVLEDDSCDYCLCIIEGDDTGIRKAQRIIYQILEEFSEMEMNSCLLIEKATNKFNESSLTEDDKRGSDSLQHSLVSDYLTDHTQKLESSTKEGLIPVYVSAVATPESFWVQTIKTREHIELDRLTEELCEFYKTNPEFDIPPRYADVKVGYICATYSAEDNRWYRAEVVEISSRNESNVKETTLDLYLLDYGVSSYQKIKNIRKIPQKFLALKFQAIDCGLAHVKPNSVDESWSPQALSFFEDITHFGQWYVLMARIDYEDENGRPQLTLIDTNSQQDINLADEMVKKGYAKYTMK